MKTTLLLTRSLQIAILALTCSQANQALAQTIYIKGNNTTSLSANGSYTTPGVPGVNDTIVYDSNSGTASASIGAGVSVQGIRYDSLATPGTINSNGTNALTLGSGGLIKDTNGLARISSPISLSADQTWNLNNGTTTSNSTRLGGSITTGLNTLLIQGSGALDLQGSSTLGSLVTINNPLVQVTNNSVVTLGGTNGFDTLQIPNGRVIGSTFGNFGSASSFGDGGTSTAITLGASSSNGTFEYSGTSTSSNRTFSRVANGNSTVGNNNGIIDVSTAGQTLTLTGNNSLSSVTSTTAGGWSLGGNGSLIVSAGILNNTNNGTTAVNKFGTGSVTLSGNNTYRGPTTITAGTLIINGSTTTNSTVSVGSGAALAGSGTINGSVSINSGATLIPSTASTLTLGSTLTLESVSTIALTLGSNSSKIAFTTLSDNLLGSGNATLSLIQGVGFDYGATYTIFQNTLTTGFVFSSITGYDSNNWTANFGLASDNYQLSFTAVPEPATWAILALGALTLLVARFRKTSRA
jgi:autotransporter-associated beta strand protein